MADQDPAALAREVLAIAEKATPGPWRGDRWDGTAKYAVLAPLDAFPTEYTNGTADRWEPVLTLNHKSGEYGFTGHKDGQGEANERLVIHAGTHYANLATAVLALTEERDALRRTLGSARASIRLVLNRDKISEWTAGALREAETEIDAALRGKEGT